MSLASRALVGLAVALLVGVFSTAGHCAGQRPDFSNVAYGAGSTARIYAFHVEPPTPPQPTISHRIPERCRQWQRQLTAEAHSVFGLAAPIPALAAQIEAESACRSDAHSSVGACGLTEFMPETAAEMAERYPDVLSPADCTNPRWAIAAQVRYMHELTVDRPARTACDRFAFGFSAYNGGDGWVRRDQKRCSAAGRCDWLAWFANVELHSGRSNAAMIENRTYVKRILVDYAPGYADWGTPVSCTPD